MTWTFTNSVKNEVKKTKKKLYTAIDIRLLKQEQLHCGNSMTKPANISDDLHASRRNQVAMPQKQVGVVAGNKLIFINNIDRLSLLCESWNISPKNKVSCQRSVKMLASSHNWCHGNADVYAPFYTAVSLNVDGNILKEFQLPHHHSISLVLLIPHLVTKAQLQWEKGCRMWSFWKPDWWINCLSSLQTGLNLIDKLITLCMGKLIWSKVWYGRNIIQFDLQVNV